MWRFETCALSYHVPCYTLYVYLCYFLYVSLVKLTSVHNVSYANKDSNLKCIKTVPWPVCKCIVWWLAGMYLCFIGMDATIFNNPLEACMGMFIMSLGEFSDIYDSFHRTKFDWLTKVWRSPKGAICKAVKLPWIFPGTPLTFSGAYGNI